MTDSSPQTGISATPRHTLEFLCPGCRRRNRTGLGTGTWETDCQHCSRSLALERGPGEEAVGPIQVCAVCGGNWFYLQKDFNQKIGCGVVLVGILFSFHTYGLSLVACALVDLALYRWLPWVTVCYYCQAHYRGIPLHPSHRAHDLQIAETTTREREQGGLTLRNLPEGDRGSGKSPPTASYPAG